MSFDSHKLWSLLAGIMLVTVPFFPQIPLLVTALSLIMALWVVAVILNKTRQPDKWQRAGLLLLAVLVMSISFGTLLGRDAGTGFLILLVFLKMFEINGKRDIYIIVYVEYFLIASNFFHTQSPWITLYVFATVIYLTSILILFSDKVSTLNTRRRLTIAGRMILQATPFMLILFILFPRIPGPLWGLPKDAQAAVTGLSNSMSPGSVSSLIESEEIAFRVRFAGQIPPHADLYWRGPVFSRYDGQTWKADNAFGNTTFKRIEDESKTIQYTVTLEPHQRNWLFALNYPVNLQGSGYRLTREAQLLNRKKINSVTRYSLTSDPGIRNYGLSTYERTQNLRLPDTGNLNRKTTALARQWRERAGEDDRRVIDEALRYFSEQPFVYTLNPPLLGNDAMDDFLFETRRGFCEHYSSAFVYLARAAGIPARIVTGYQGGEKNPVDEYLIVRQSSAHAWAEVWFDDTGWQRVDPTAAVSPDRIESGIQDAVAERGRLPAILFGGNSMLVQLRYRWDSFSYRWDEWVIGFNRERQFELFKRLGFANADWQGMVMGMVILLALVGTVIGLWVFRQGAGARKDRLKQAYDRLCQKLARTGISRDSVEAPTEYLSRIRHKLTPASADNAKDLIRYYIALRYGTASSSTRKKQFIKNVQRFTSQLK